MNCIIPGSNLKIIHKALQSLHKLSEEVCLECKPETLSLVSTNINTTALARYNFHEVFFTSYNVEHVDSQSSTNSPHLSCNVYIKSLLSIFKVRMDKKVETCKLEFEAEKNELWCTQKYVHSGSIVHKIRVLDFKYISWDYNVRDTTNCISMTGQYFNSIISNFQLNDTDLNLEIKANDTIIRNYAINSSCQGLRTQVNLSKNDCLTYNIQAATMITPPLKFLRSAVSFAEHFNLDVRLYFTTSGNPVIVVLRTSTFNAEFVIATVNTEHDDADVSMTSLRQSNAKVTNKSSPQLITNNLLLDKNDQTAINNAMDWDDDDFASASPVRCSLGAVLEALKRPNEDECQTSQKRFKKTNQIEEMDYDRAESPVLGSQRKISEKCRVVFARWFDNSQDSVRECQVLAPPSDEEDG